MQTEAEPTNWRAVAAAYKKRLHSLCVFSAFALYVTLVVGTGRLLEWLRVEPVWVENIALFIWLPLGGVAYYAKNRFEDWADKGLPQP
jgi:hypothetical protein